MNPYEVLGVAPSATPEESKREQNVQQYLRLRMTRVLIDHCLKIMEDWDYQVDPQESIRSFDPYMSPFFTRSTYAR